MVKLQQDSGGSADKNPNQNSSCSVEASLETLKMNGNVSKTFVNGDSTAKMTIKETTVLKGTEKVNGNDLSIKENFTVNGYCDKMSVSKNSAIPYNKVVVNGVAKVNGICDGEVPEVIRMVNGKCNKDDGNYSNSSSTPSENGSVDSLCSQDNCDENQDGFILVTKKNRTKKKNKFFRKKQSTNLPPGLNTESIRRDNKNDKNCSEKASSPTHLSQKPPRRNFAAVRSTAKSYSSVLVNGQNGNSQIRNGCPNTSSDAPNFTKHNPSLTNCSFPEPPTSVDQLSTDLTKSAVINDSLAATCGHSELVKKIEMTDVSAQTEIITEPANEPSPSQKECLASHEEVIHDPVKSQSPSDYGEISDESSNVAYCDSLYSVDKKEGDGESSNIENHGEIAEDVVTNGVEYYKGEIAEDVVTNGVEYYNGEIAEDVVTNGVEYYNDMSGIGYAHMVCHDPLWTGNLVSNDSGRGDSEITYDNSMPYCCEFPKEKTSQLIGKGGSFKYEIEKKSGVTLWVFNDETSKDFNIIRMIGTGAQIEKAKELIRERFRHVTLRQWLGNNPTTPQLSDDYSAKLSEGTDFSGVVSCICTPDFFWVQPFGHPHYYKLQDVERRMSDHFNTVFDAPAVTDPIPGSVVAVPGAMAGETIRWIRGWIISLIKDDGMEDVAVVRYLDWGGEYQIPVSRIRPMRHDFFSMPFFAAQCCLHDILPKGGEWSEDALAEFTRLCNGSQKPPIVRVMGKTPDFYYVTMFGFDPEINAQVDIAAHLIAKGFGVRPAVPATAFQSEFQH